VIRPWAIVLFCMLGVGASGPPVPTTTDIDTVTAYHQAVGMYREGRLPDAIRAVRAIPMARLAPVGRLMAYARTLSPSNIPAEYQAFAWTRLDLLAAGLLQGDASLISAQANDGGFDGEVTESLGALHLADVPRDADEHPGTYELTWARAAGVILLENMASNFASTELTLALHHFPDDGPLLLTMGTLREAEAGPLSPPEWNPNSSNPLFSGRVARDHVRDEARDALEHAVRIMPGSDEARVRLGNVFISMRKDDRAAPLLEAVSRSADVEWAYLATMMLGGVRERANDPAGAERLYREAMVKIPDAQAASVALGALQYAGGKVDEAASTTETLLARRATAPAHEPWWEYPLGSSTKRDAALKSLADLRAQVRP
jgi:hypothetical protein